MTSQLAGPYYPSPTGKQAIYYHTTWACYAREFNVKDLPIDRITDIAYAFFNVGPDGKVFSGDSWADFDNPLTGTGVEPQNTWQSPAEDLGNLGQFNKLRKQGKKFNMQLSVGGWSWSGRFSEAVSTPQTRQTMVDSILAVFQRWPKLFNGVSLDWEYLSDDGKNYGLDGNTARREDADNFIALLKLLRETLGKGFRISMCTVAAPEKIKMPVAKIHPLVDEVHIMTYDFMDGRWGGTGSGHHTNLRQAPGCPYSAEQAVETWRSLGVPPSKLFIGVAFYSRGFDNTDGLGKPCVGGSPDKSWEDGVVDYKALPLPGSEEKWDPVAQASYSYDPKRRVLNSYDCPRSVLAKCEFIHAQGLGGLLVWESSGDHPYTHPRSLMRVIHDNLTHAAPGSAPAEKPKPVEKPVVVAPAVCTCKCTCGAKQPAKQPEKPVEKPVKPVEKPVEKPSKPVEKPVEKPSKPVEKPVEKPAASTIPAGALVAQTLADFGRGGVDNSLVFPRGAAKEIDNITQVGPRHFRFELRMRGNPWSTHNPRGTKGAWYDGDRDLEWNEGKRDNRYHDKSRAEVHDLFRKTPREPVIKAGETWDIATTVKLDKDFVPSQMYCNLMQPVFDQSFLSLTGIKGDDVTAQLMVFVDGIGSQIKVARSFTIKRGQWTSIVVRIKFSKEGKYEASVNGDAFKGISLDTSKRMGGFKWGLYATATTSVLGKPMKDLVCEHRDIYVRRV